MKNKLIGQAYVNIIKDENGEIKFSYGYEMDGKFSARKFKNNYLDKWDIEILTIKNG